MSDVYEGHFLLLEEGKESCEDFQWIDWLLFWDGLSNIFYIAYSALDVISRISYSERTHRAGIGIGH